jgi:hypothetical protein
VAAGKKGRVQANFGPAEGAAHKFPIKPQLQQKNVTKKLILLSCATSANLSI